MLLIQAQNVMRRFGDVVLFHNVNLQINEHDRTALVGRNGAGKTTLLKILAGITEPDEGRVSTSKGLTIGYLAQDQGLSSQRSIWDELDSVFHPLHQLEEDIKTAEQKLATLDPSEENYQRLSTEYDRLQQQYQKAGGFSYQSKMRGVLNGFGFSTNEYQLKVDSLSGGQKTRLALVKILLQEPGLLILDEPTNHLDMGTLTWLEDYLKGYSGALLIVSHDRYFLDRVVTTVYDLDNRTLHRYSGNYTQYTHTKAERLKTAWKHYNEQQAEIAKLQDYVNRNLVRASTTKQAQARRRQLEKMDRLEKPSTDDHSIHFHFNYDHPSGNEVLEVKQAIVGWDGQKLAGPLSFKIKKGQRAGIIGPNGIGKSTLFKSLTEKIPLLGGDFKFGANVQIGYYDQEMQSLHPNKTVLDEVWDEHKDVDEADIRRLLGSFLFVGDDVFKPVHDLSGGEKARLELTKLSFKPANLLVLDEPTNHLDVDSRSVLEEAINSFEGTVLFISHDRYFINQVASDVYDMRANGITHYEGNYDAYLAAIDNQEAAADNASAPTLGAKTGGSQSHQTKARQSYQQNKQTQRERRKLSRRVDQIEQQMNDLENQAQDLQQQMAEPSIATDIGKLTELQKQLDTVNHQSSQVEDQWTTAAEELEDFDNQHQQ